MVVSFVFVSPTFPDESGNLMSWPIVGGRVLIYWQVMSNYGDHSDVAEPICTITRPDGTEVVANIATDVIAPQHAFEFYPDAVGAYTGLVYYDGGLVVSPGIALDPSSEVLDFVTRECYGSVVEQEVCSDGSTIVTIACVNGYAEPTEATCPAPVKPFPWWLLLLIASGGMAFAWYVSDDKKRKK